MGMRPWTYQTFKWYSRFLDGGEFVEDDERGGCPKSNRTEVNIAAVVDLVKTDCRIASRMIAESLDIPRLQLFGFWNSISALEIFSCCTTMRPSTKLQVFARFFTPKMLQPFITPPPHSVLSRFVSARLFSVPEFENEVRRTLLCGCC
jgi:hypothetical protein